MEKPRFLSNARWPDPEWLLVAIPILIIAALLATLAAIDDGRTTDGSGILFIPMGNSIVSIPIGR